MESRIRKVLAENGNLRVDVRELTCSDDLFAAGLNSHASVNVMLALEDEFDVEFPDSAMKKFTFTSIDNLTKVLKELDSAG